MFKKISLILVLAMAFSLISVSAEGYTLTITTDATEDIQNGDTVIATVTLNTTEGLKGAQFVMKYDPEAFDIVTENDAYQNFDWKYSYMVAGIYNQVPQTISFFANPEAGKISCVSVTSSGTAVSSPVKDVAIMGINLIVKDAEKAKGSVITILQDNTLTMSTDIAGAEIPEITETVIPGTPSAEATPAPEAEPITVTVNGTEVMFEKDNLPETIIIALYNDSGIMQDVKLHNRVNITDNHVTENFTGYTAKSFVRVMGWYDLDSIEPLGACHIINLV